MKQNLDNIDELFRSKLNEKFQDDSLLPNEHLMWERLDQKLEQKNEKRRRVFWWQAGFAAAACLLLFLFGKEQFRETPNETKQQVISKQNPVEPKVLAEKIEPEKVLVNTPKKIIEQPKQSKEIFEIQVVDKKVVTPLIIDKEISATIAYEIPNETKIYTAKEPRKFRVVHSSELTAKKFREPYPLKTFIVHFNPPMGASKSYDYSFFSIPISKKE